MTIDDVMRGYDVVLAFSDGGQSGACFAKLGEDRFARMPFEVEAHYDADDSRPEGQVRRIKVTAGWSQEEFDALMAAQEEATTDGD